MHNTKRVFAIFLIAALVLGFVPSPLIAAPMSGAIYTTDAGGKTNVNNYSSRQDLYLNGGPQKEGSAGLPDGSYYCQITAPNGSVLGTSVGGVGAFIKVTNGSFEEAYHIWTYFQYDVSPNGVYKIWVSQDPAFPSDFSKTDNFKVEGEVVPAPAIRLTKTATEPSFSAVGDIIHYTFTVENIGNVTLTNVFVTDAKVSVSGGPLASLAAGASDNGTFTATYTITQADLDAGRVDNTAWAYGSYEQTQVSDDDSETVYAATGPAIKLTKTATETSFSAVGDIIHYTFTVQNIGNVTLTNVSVTDAKVTVVGGPLASLAAGASDSTTFTATYTITQADLDAARVDNTAWAHGYYGEMHVSDDDSETVYAATGPAIKLTKTATETSFSAVGNIIHYTFTVQNIGNVTLTNVSVTDAKVTVVGGPLASLAAGASDSTTFTATYTITQADLDAGQVDNTAWAHGYYGEMHVSDDDSETVYGSQEPTISVTLTKTVSPANRPAPGGVFNFTITITNTSSVSVRISELTDTNAAAASALAPYLDSELPYWMEPGQVITINYPVTHTTVGTYNNTAFVRVTYEGEMSATAQDSATCRVYAVQDEPGSLTVVKLTNEGQPLTGATFAVYRGETKLDERTLTGSSYTWANLDAGTYRVVEVAAPAGWIIREASMTVSLNQGQDRTVTFYNDPIGKGSITVIKLNTAGQPLNGATFALYLGSTKLDERVLTGNTYTWGNLNAGTYTVVEVAAPAGYVKANPDRVTVTLVAGATTISSETVTFRNPPAPGSITVLKLVRDEATGATSPLAGVTFALYKPDQTGTLLDQRTLTGSEYTWSNLEPGAYTVVEVAAPNRPDGTPFELADPVLVIVPAGQNVRVEIFNNLPLTGTSYLPQFFAGLSMIGLGFAVRRRRVF